MLRIASLSAVLLITALVLTTGCGPAEKEKKPDMPIKTSEGVNKKGQKTKSFEASFEDTPKK